jgi:two-component system sensor histidine kinase HydH
MKWLPRPNITYVSPWLLAAAMGLLVLIVVTFALSNIQREKQLMTNAMLQKAATLNRVISSASRASYNADLRRGVWKPDPWDEHVQRVIDHLAGDPDLYFLAVVDAEGVVFAHNRPVMRGKKLHLHIPDPFPKKGGRAPFMYRVEEEKGQPRFFEVISPFIPFFSRLPSVPLSLRQLHKQFASGDEGLSFSPLRIDKGSEHLKKYFTIVALDMKGYDRALGRLRFQMLMLSLTMLLVGIGGWLSLAAVHGYRVSRRALHEIQAFTGLLVSKLPVGIIATDKSGTVATWNQAVAELTGIKVKQATGKKPGDILPQALADFFLDAGVREDQADTVESQDVSIDMHGEHYSLNCHHLIISDRQGAPEGEVLLLSNMTELKNLEIEMRENERLAAVGRMAAGVAHEVRNPLSSIKGLALLLQGKFIQKSHEHETASLLIQEVERMNRTISELLSFTRPAPLELAKVDVGELLDRQIRLLGADGASDNIVFHLAFGSGLQPIAADRDRMNQVLLNVLLNGIQAMETGGDLTIQAWNNTEKHTVVLTVTDTGFGMDKETLSQVFFPYFTTKGNGTGIGMALSQKIVVDHGGTIHLSSTKGQGTVVTIELPQYFGPE